MSEQNVEPTHRGGSYLLYHAPYRKDDNPSMAVYPGKNTWKDYATGQGGSIIDLVMVMQQTDFLTATKKLLGTVPMNYMPPPNSNNVPTPAPPVPRTESGEKGEIVILKETQLSNKALLSYLEMRGIPYNIAKEHLKEVYFTTKEGQKVGKRYFAIAFKNDSGGYELRNKYFKGASSKNITTIDCKSDKCLIFEGFFDYLSYLTLAQQKGVKIEENAVVLNSLALLDKAKLLLCQQKEMHCYLDNDEAGKRAVECIKKWSDKIAVIDKSDTYIMHKDLNEYLQEKHKINYNYLKINRYGKGRNS